MGLGPTLLDHPQSEAVRALVDAAALASMRRRAALGVVIVVVDVPTGGLLALGDYGGASLRTFPPSGTLRPLVLAAAIEEGADPEGIYPGGRGWLRVGGDVIHDSHLWDDPITMSEMVALSAVVAPVMVANEYLSAGRWGDWLARLGLMNAGELQPLPWTPTRTALEATGHGHDMSPVALARAYAVVANDGRAPDGRQLLHVETARAVSAMLEAAVSEDMGTGVGARVPGMRVGGKTSCEAVPPMQTAVGTPSTPSMYCSFVGMLPMEAPRLVVLVGVETRSVTGWGDPEGLSPYQAAAAPDFARLAPQLLRIVAP